MSAFADPPVVLFVYNRPALVARVFDAIREARPSRLYVFADGPLPGSDGDAVRTDAARGVTERIDWPCDVHRDYAPGHVGIKRRVESGLNCVFADAEAAIIVEDDALPASTFFRYCRELLVRYRDDARVMSICGPRMAPALAADAGVSYNFSRYTATWAWATWRRAWRYYDGAMRGWPEHRAAGWLATEFDDPQQVAYWTYLFDRNLRRGDEGDWDVAWVFSCWVRGGLAAIPTRNQICNIGFSEDATHTKNPHDALATMPTSELTFPLQHPPEIVRSIEEERATDDLAFSGNITRMMGQLHRRIHRARNEE